MKKSEIPVIFAYPAGISITGEAVSQSFVTIMAPFNRICRKCRKWENEKASINEAFY
jgi:hypothetical protein